MELDYKDYYLRTIARHDNGFKLVLGGTGLGKTYGMRSAVISYLTEVREEKKKFIYSTNRHLLITQQNENFKELGFHCCYLKKNQDIILDLFENKEIEMLIKELGDINYFKFDEELKEDSLRKVKLDGIIESIYSKKEFIEVEKKKDSPLRKTIQKDLGSECEDLFKLLKTQFVLIGQRDKSLHASLKLNKFIWKLFPYVEFENNPDANILLATIHKLLGGFFDGKQDIKITSIENKIIFLDEFDFLERDIIKILCDEPSIVNPLEFVRIFYEKFTHWSKLDFWNTTSELKKIRDKFYEVIEYLQSAMMK